MTIDCSLNWMEICPIIGPCIRPGGTDLTERALKSCDLAAGSLIADIGCGAGATLAYIESFGSYRLVGIDRSEPLLGEAKQELKTARLVRGSAEMPPFGDACFDALFCECVLSTLPNKMATIAEFVRVLKGGGVLIVSDVFIAEAPSVQGKHGVSPTAASPDGLFTREGLRTLLEGFGLSLVLWEEHKRVLKEFVAALILAGERLPDSWCVQPKQQENGTGRTGISYFLLVARKKDGRFGVTENI